MEYGCIAEHLPHSFSKIIHAKIAPYAYDLVELTPDEVGPFLQKADFSGINVTIPYKKPTSSRSSRLAPNTRQRPALLV